MKNLNIYSEQSELYMVEDDGVTKLEQFVEIFRKSEKKELSANVF